jgi:hypothetical protein
MWLRRSNDTQTGMLLGIPRSARCVQRFDDSLNSAIHITYRISLRSSSMREPRDPLLKVVLTFYIGTKTLIQHSKHVIEVVKNNIDLKKYKGKPTFFFCKRSNPQLEWKFIHNAPPRVYSMCTVWRNDKDGQACTCPLSRASKKQPVQSLFDNDPSAGSPTETLLRLLLPLNDQV